MWVVMTDPFSGTLPWSAKWGKGLRGFVGAEAPLMFVFSGAKLFWSKEEAEGAAFVLAIEIPEVIGHLHVMDEWDARDVYGKEMGEWYSTMNADLKVEGTGAVFLAS